ncbi:uncharacterized protein ISCGN_023871 [Ixodes scapularis]
MFVCDEKKKQREKHKDTEPRGGQLPVTRGVRQGCPLSLLLFVLSLEPFLTNIDRCSLVRGIPLPGSGEVKVFTTYGSLSGARLNEQKSKALWVNRPPDPAFPLPAAAVVKILGVTFNAMGISPEMWTRIARDITASVDRARDYALPMAERRYLAHSVFCGRLWYLAQVVVPPRSFIRQVRSSLFRFSWMEKTELVTRQVLSLPREKGGWGFPCVDGTPALLQLKTMLMILHEAENPARSLALYFVGHSHQDLGVDLTGPSGACAGHRPRLDGRRFSCIATSWSRRLNWTLRQHQRHASPKPCWNHSSLPCRLDSRIRPHGCLDVLATASSL